MHDQAVPIYTDGFKSSGCADVFHDFELLISLPVVASIFTAELYAIFLAISRISFHNNNFVLHSDFRNALQAIGSL